MKKVIILLVSAGLFAVATSAMASGSVSKGKILAGSCVGCHGVGGVSSNPDWPSLGGQSAGYTAKQLADFKSGARKNRLMSDQAAGLTKAQMADLGAYYAAQKSPRSMAKNAKLAKKGEKLYRGGNSKTGVAACMACHGPSGLGIPPHYPAVTGQHAKYTATQLRAFKRGTRKNDNNIMSHIAFRMSHEEISAVSAYMEGLTVR
ncbi:MAG: c-type cytochrome [Acidiferrobacterales bacterium]